MDWVIRKLKSLLRSEQMIGTRHTPLKGDKKYAISAQFSSERIPQLKQAIQILESANSPPVNVKKPKPEKRNPKQLKLF